MNFRRTISKSRAGHWTLTLTDTGTGNKAYGEKHDSKESALAEEPELQALLQTRAARIADYLAALGPCGK